MAISQPTVSLHPGNPRYELSAQLTFTASIVYQRDLTPI